MRSRARTRNSPSAPIRAGEEADPNEQVRPVHVDVTRRVCHRPGDLDRWRIQVHIQESNEVGSTITRRSSWTRRQIEYPPTNSGG
jgi:hypothetical protein